MNSRTSDRPQGVARCQVVADGFYEWQGTQKGRMPYRFGIRQWKPFDFVGLGESWRSPQEDLVHSSTIITTRSNELVERIHTRMPVMLSNEGQSTWLDECREAADLKELRVPYPSAEMEACQVSNLVNSPGNDLSYVIELVD